MQIVLNGKNETLNQEQISLTVLLKSKGLDKESVVVLLNDEIVKRGDIDKVSLNDGDRVEILRFVAGG